MGEDDIINAVDEAVRVKDHLEKDITDRCGYCGQHFGPDDIVVEKEVYSRKWTFCNSDCYDDFVEKSNFKDEDLDGDNDPVVKIE